MIWRTVWLISDSRPGPGELKNRGPSGSVFRLIEATSNDRPTAACCVWLK